MLQGSVLCKSQEHPARSTPGTMASLWNYTFTHVHTNITCSSNNAFPLQNNLVICAKKRRVLNLPRQNRHRSHHHHQPGPPYKYWHTKRRSYLYYALRAKAGREGICGCSFSGCVNNTLWFEVLETTRESTFLQVENKRYPFQGNLKKKKSNFS